MNNNFFISQRLQLLFQKFRGVGYAVRTITKYHACTDTLQEFALCSAITLLKLCHNLFHAGSGFITVLCGQAQNHSCANKCATGTLHIAHTGTIGSGNIQSGLLRKAYQVTICTYHRLCAVM